MNQPSQFVILRHTLPADSPGKSHWDLMLQAEGRLRTWRLDQLPAEHAEVSAVGLPDHRLEYLEYEGPVSGHRGQVARWDRGRCIWIESTRQRLVADLDGHQLHGRLSLNRDADDGQRWTVGWVPADSDPC